MRGACMITACLAFSAAAAPAIEPPTNVVAEQVRGIRMAEAEPDAAVLLAYVIDDAGDPLDGVAVAVLQGGREVAAGTSDPRGRVLLRLRLAGRVVVRAAESGLVPTEARRVVLRKGGLTAVVLPLEAEETKREKKGEQ